MQCHKLALLALELTHFVRLFFVLSSHFLDCISVAMNKCAMPLSEPLDDHRPRSEKFWRHWCIRGGRASIVTMVLITPSLGDKWVCWNSGSHLVLVERYKILYLRNKAALSWYSINLPLFICDLVASVLYFYKCMSRCEPLIDRSLWWICLSGLPCSHCVVRLTGKLGKRLLLVLAGSEDCQLYRCC